MRTRALVKISSKNPMSRLFSYVHFLTPVHFMYSYFSVLAKSLTQKKQNTNQPNM